MYTYCTRIPFQLNLWLYVCLFVGSSGKGLLYSTTRIEMYDQIYKQRDRSDFFDFDSFVRPMLFWFFFFSHMFEQKFPPKNPRINLFCLLGKSSSGGGDSEFRNHRHRVSPPLSLWQSAVASASMVLCVCPRGVFLFLIPFLCFSDGSGELCWYVPHFYFLSLFLPCFGFVWDARTYTAMAAVFCSSLVRRDWLMLLLLLWILPRKNRSLPLTAASSFSGG